MCGRMCCTLYPKYLIHYSGSHIYDPAVLGFRPKWNCPPQSKVLTCYQVCDETTHKITRVLTLAIWSLVPPFADDPFARVGYSTFNARCEGLTSSRMYSRLMNSKRCVIFADGFYEWLKFKSEKTPFYFLSKDTATGGAIKILEPPEEPNRTARLAQKPWRPAEELDRAWDEAQTNSRFEETATSQEPPAKKAKKDSEEHSLTCTTKPIILAGLYDVWHKKESEIGPVTSTTVVTMDSKGTAMEDIHDRMPCCISPEMAAKWLACESFTFRELEEELKTDSVKTMNEHLRHYQVECEVGNVRNDYKELIIDINKGKPVNKQAKIGDFFVKKSPPSTQS